MEILHCTKNGSDKIWGWTKDTTGSVICFWGRRKKTLSFIQHEDIYSVRELARAKQRKGYIDIPLAHKDEYLPEDFDGQLLLAQLGQVRIAV